MATLAEWSLPIPQVRGLNPVIGKLCTKHTLLFSVKRLKKTEEEAGNGPFLIYSRGGGLVVIVLSLSGDPSSNRAGVYSFYSVKYIF